MWVRSVSDVTRQIKALLDGDPDLRDFWIRGEVSNFQRATSGHCYFTLKDSECELRAVMWRSSEIRQNWLPGQGDLVSAFGTVSVYERGGAYQFYAESLEPAGEGALWEEFRRLQARLEAEGLFASERKRPLPKWPRRIGVVSSRDGAAWRDITRVISERYPVAELVLASTQVQGSEAPEQIVRAIRHINQQPDIDVMIVGRGGGSLEDLWAFNDERVARALVASRIPVVSGVGHETDMTIADLVADLRAPTPSAAAAAVTPDGYALREQIRLTLTYLYTATSRKLGDLNRDLKQREHILRLHDPRRRILEQRQRLDQAVDRLERAQMQCIATRRAAISNCAAWLQALDPMGVLGRGYTILEHLATGQRVWSVAQVRPLDSVRIHLYNGELDARIEGARAHNDVESNGGSCGKGEH